MNSNELFLRIIELGIPYDSHASDLYIPKTEQTTKLISEYEFKENVTTFIANTEDVRCRACGHKIKQPKEVWYDIPFAYAPFWERVKCNGQRV